MVFGLFNNIDETDIDKIFHSSTVYLLIKVDETWFDSVQLLLLTTLSSCRWCFFRKRTIRFFTFSSLIILAAIGSLKILILKTILHLLNYLDNSITSTQFTLSDPFHKATCRACYPASLSNFTRIDEAGFC